MKEMYEGIVQSTTEGLEQSIIQIKRDINRTYPTHPLFKSDSERFNTLEKLLITYWKYDRCIGYVQGMNFIMGCLMYHWVEPDITFWLFVSIIEQYQLWDNYKGDLKGIRKHWGVIKLLIEEELPELAEHFVKNEMRVEMFATDWILGLFSSIIPIQQMGMFLDNFFKNKWDFFYKIVLVFLRDIQKELLQEEEMWDVLVTLKSLATPLRSEHSPAPSHRSFKTSIFSRFKKESEYSTDKRFHSPVKGKGFGFMDSIRDIFKEKQYTWDWMNILKKATTYKIKNPAIVCQYIIKYELTH